VTYIFVSGYLSGLLLLLFIRDWRRDDASASTVDRVVIAAGVGKELRESLGEALHGPLTDLVRPNPGRRLLKTLKTLTSLKASYDAAGTWTFGLDLSSSAGGGADTGVLETDLTKLIKDLSAAAEEEGRGLAILIE